jgi:MFS family permease
MLAGFAVISHWMPFLLFSVYSGALADRYDCRRLIQAGQILFMVASLSWGLLFLTGTLRMWHAVVLLLLHGAAGVTVVPATQLILHDMVGRRSFRARSSQRHGALLAIPLGPAVGAWALLLDPRRGLANVWIYAVSIF